MSLKDYGKAILDARRVIAIKPKWAKGHSRLAAAHFALQDYSEVRQIILCACLSFANLTQQCIAAQYSDMYH